MNVYYLHLFDAPTNIFFFFIFIVLRTDERNYVVISLP